jgi:transcriptional regulator GlxA family with amidase domain
MAAHFQKPFQLHDLVAESGMSRRGFIKAFNKHICHPPAAVLRQMRIDQARHLLVTERLSLKELAERVGFRRINTFCVAFQRVVGIAPKKFQRLNWPTICRDSRPPKMTAN